MLTAWRSTFPNPTEIGHILAQDELLTQDVQRLGLSKRMVKKQQMRWSKHVAHHLLQVRTKVLNDELRQTFAGLCPGMQTNVEEQQQKTA